MNFLPASVSAAAPAGAATLGVRPEYVTLAREGDAGALQAQVVQAQDVGTYWLIHAKVGDHVVRARLSAEAAVPKVGDTVWLGVVGPRTCFYAANEQLIEVAA